MPRPLPVLIFAAALAACSGDRKPETSAPAPSASAAPSKATFAMEAEPVAEVGNLCLFRPRKDPIMSGFADGTGAAWEGELRVRDLASLDTKWISQQDKRIATAVARPRAEVFRARIDDNCYDAARKVYYACSKVIEADLSQIRGFARAPNIGRARALAIQLCEKKVDAVMDEKVQIKQDNLDLRCRVIEQAFCELPPAPPPPPAPKKK